MKERERNIKEVDKTARRQPTRGTGFSRGMIRQWIKETWRPKRQTETNSYKIKMTSNCYELLKDALTHA